jgi:SAM-dependent methyltransferase
MGLKNSACRAKDKQWKLRILLCLYHHARCLRVRLTDPITHYQTDAELFDYFEPRRGVDLDAQRRTHEAVLRAARPEGRVLDAGSGSGWMADACGARARVMSVDVGLHNLKRLRTERPDALLICADVTRLPFRTGCFDVAVAAEVLEHLNAPDAALRELARCVRPGGRVTVTTPYRERIRTYLCIHCNRPTPANAHLHSFDEQRHEALAAEAGLPPPRLRLLLNPQFVQIRLSYLLRCLPHRAWALLDVACARMTRRAHFIISTTTTR